MIPRTLLPSEIATDARVKKLARQLGTDRATALGCLVALWCEASLHHDGSDALFIEAGDLAEAANYLGNGSDLAGALIESLLAEKVDGGGIRLVMYEDCNGPYRRERDAKIANSKAWRENRKAAAPDREPSEADSKTNVFANAVANTSTSLSGLSVSTTPPPPPPGGPRVRSRSPRPGTKAAETDELLLLGSHRGTPDPNDDGGLHQSQRTEIAVAYRRAADKARAKGDHAKADDYARKADELDAKGSPAAMGRCALREG